MVELEKDRLLHLRRLRRGAETRPTAPQFIDALIEVRYRDGVVGFQAKHFFTAGRATPASRPTSQPPSATITVQVTKDPQLEGFRQVVLCPDYHQFQRNDLLPSQSGSWTAAR